MLFQFDFLSTNILAKYNRWEFLLDQYLFFTNLRTMSRCLILPVPVVFLLLAFTDLNSTFNTSFDFWHWLTIQSSWSWRWGSRRERTASSGCGRRPCRTSCTACASCCVSFQRSWFPWSSWDRLQVIWNTEACHSSEEIQGAEMVGHHTVITSYLELQLLEEPSVLAGLVSLLELGADHVPGLLLLHGILKHIHL